MTRDEKIIEIRTSAKVKLEDLKAKMKTAIARAAQTHADILAGRTDKCDNERFNEIERFKAEKLAIEACFSQERAALYAETETACKEATDDPEEEKPQQVQKPTLWLDGSQHTAAIVARRILSKLPAIPKGGCIDISLEHYADSGIGLQLKAYNPNREGNKFEEVWLRENNEPEKQADDVSNWLERAERLLAYKPSNDHVAEPLGRALDAIFGGNPLDDFPTTRKEAENE